MKQTDDIDLIDLVLTLWRSKWIIFSSIFILISTGLIFKLFKNDTYINYEAIYQSELNYSVNLPFYNFNKTHYLHNIEKLLNEFEETLHLEGNFNDWKGFNNQANLNYEDINDTQEINGILFSKNLNDVLLNFKHRENRGHVIVLRSNDISIFNEIYSYTNYVVDNLTSKYKLLIENEVISIDNDFTKFNKAYPDAASNDYKYRLNLLEAYLMDIERGERVIKIDYPTIPFLVNPEIKPYKSYIVYFASLFVIGGILGIFIVFIKENILRYKKNK